MITIIMIIFWEALKFRKLHLHRNLQWMPFLIHPDQADQNEKSDTVGEEKTSAGMPELRKILLIIGAAMLLLIIILSIALAKKEKRYYG